MKIVINTKHGGFGLSHAAIMRYAELSGFTLYHETRHGFTEYYKIPVEEYRKLVNQNPNARALFEPLEFYDRRISRTDPVLIQVVEELGDAANGDHARLKVVEVPDDVQWQIEEYNGSEWVAEKHRTWS